jgi:hypothetical protein
MRAFEQLLNGDGFADVAATAQRPSFADLFANHDLIDTTNEPWPPRAWLKRIYRRITRRSGGTSK